MSVLVAVADGAEGRAALAAAAAEAALLGTELVAVNLTLDPLDRTEGPLADAGVTVLERSGPQDRDPAVAVLDELAQRGDVHRLVIGVRRRSRVGKMLLGSISQRLLLESPVPVLAVKPD